MVKLTDEMKQDFAKMKIFPFATASKGGEPNVIPIGILRALPRYTFSKEYYQANCF